MPEYRQDLITGRRVIIASERTGRPDRFSFNNKGGLLPRDLPGYQEDCPFCYGNEKETPEEVAAWREGSHNDPDWQVRVVPNRFPMVELKGGAERFLASPGMGFERMNGYGIHEVIVETPEHNRHPGEFSAGQMKIVLEAYQHRLQVLSDYENLKYAQLFRNHLRQAGASVEHPHSQLVGLPFVPGEIQQELEGAYRFYLKEGICPYCYILEEEKNREERVIYQDAYFLALMPFAARLPFETWILPRKHISSFTGVFSEELTKLAEVFTEMLSRFNRLLNHPPYNLYLHTAPFHVGSLPNFHWHLEFLPRLTTEAGFEIGTGVYVNVTLPEEAAKFIKEGEVSTI